MAQEQVVVKLQLDERNSVDINLHGVLMHFVVFVRPTNSLDSRSQAVSSDDGARIARNSLSALDQPPARF